MSQTMSKFASDIMNRKYAHDLGDRKETWEEIANRVAVNVMGAAGFHPSDSLVKEIAQAIAERKFIPGGRYLYASGRSLHQVQNCVLNRAEDSREGWADLLHKIAMSLMTGAGVGVVYSDVRPRGTVIQRTGGFATGPISLMQMVNECGRGIQQGGSRRSALWAGLHWNHQDVFEFVNLKNWSPEIRAMKDKDFNAIAPMDGTNISVILDTAFFEAYNNPESPMHVHAHSVYWLVVRQMLETAEPGFSIDCGKNEGENLRNACTEITSADDSDICNIGSINMARIDSVKEMERITDLGTLFLLAGTLYSHVPYDKIDRIREKNRRLGLGLMGLHEWLLKRGKAYGPDAELEAYLQVYARSTVIAKDVAEFWGISAPAKTRAIAPTGTIGIIGETTTGVEPVFCVAFKRRYLDGNDWKYQYVLDPTAKRLIDQGVDPSLIEDAYSITPQRRVAFQAWLQRFVDHGISSTINIPAWGTEANNQEKVKEFGDMLMRYLPQLRGITCYPDGSRGGQPLTPVSYSLAASNLGQVFVEAQDICDWTKGGTCGS
jgi:ribonucleoside-diphosphate reductase alpha chain